ncbi:MAG: YdjY domain-containing protein, partial [Pirellula sp.]
MDIRYLRLTWIDNHPRARIHGRAKLFLCFAKGWFFGRWFSGKPVLGMLAIFFLSLFWSKIPCADQDEWQDPNVVKKRVMDAFEAPKECTKLDRDNPIWIRRDEQVVIVDGYVVQREVPLELFACPTERGKDHESIVAVFARARTVHAGLLAINGKPGSPASFEPFKPATGTTIRVYALWVDDKQKPQGTLAQNWIRRVDTKKPMEWDWVFAGSQIYKDDEGKEHYLGDSSGELISVSNFASSTIDVAVKSDSANSNLLFEAFTDRIPKRYTPVRLVLTLCDEAPFGTFPDQLDSKAGTPKHLSEAVPERIMQYLVPKKSVEPETKKSNPTKPETAKPETAKP